VRGVPSEDQKAAILWSIEAAEIREGYIAIDYNLCVWNDGTIWEGRGLNVEDAATKAHNRDSVSVCAMGNYEHEPTSDALIVGCAEAFRYASLTGWLVDGASLHPHSETYPTACPGQNLEVRMGDLVAVYLSGPLEEETMTKEEHDWLRDVYAYHVNLSLNGALRTIDLRIQALDKKVDGLDVGTVDTTELVAAINALPAATVAAIKAAL
jgi:hypothetical protein